MSRSQRSGSRGSRKGFLFTVITLFLLISLLLLSRFYLYRSKEMQDITVTLSGEKIKYTESDISKGYFNILGINLSEIKRNSTKGIVNITFGEIYPIPSSINYNTKLANYESFLEGGYSVMTNTQITLNNFDTNFRIEPYGITFLLSGDDLYIYTDSTDLLKAVYLDVKTDVAAGADSSFTSGSPGGSNPAYPEIHVLARDSEQAVQLDRSRNLNPNDVNNPFYLQLVVTGSPDPPDPRLDVYFGSINSKPGTLRINRYLLTAEVLELQLIYATVNEKVYIKVADSIIDVKVRGMKKQGPIILAEE